MKTLKNVNIESKQSRDDADVLIIEDNGMNDRNGRINC